MARILAREKEETSMDVQEVFAEIEGAFGMVPNLFKTYSHFPPLLKANWNKVKAVMMQGGLSRKQRKLLPFWFQRTIAAHIVWLLTRLPSNPSV